jgi:hypothetical protein
LQAALRPKMEFGITSHPALPHRDAATTQGYRPKITSGSCSPTPKTYMGSFAGRSEAKNGVWHNVPPSTTTQGYRDYTGIPTENNVGIVFPDPENLYGVVSEAF